MASARFRCRPATDNHRFAPQLRTVALLDRRIEGVHVRMDDRHGLGFHDGPVVSLVMFTQPDILPEDELRITKIPMPTALRRRFLRK
jgi:hypothetical protein